MLNIELARIVVAERLRTTDEHVRQGRFQEDIVERNAAAAEARQAGREASVTPGQDPGQRTNPALG
jgi:hypothetical protein